MQKKKYPIESVLMWIYSLYCLIYFILSGFQQITLLIGFISFFIIALFSFKNRRKLVVLGLCIIPLDTIISWVLLFIQYTQTEFFEIHGIIASIINSIISLCSIVLLIIIVALTTSKKADKYVSFCDRAKWFPTILSIIGLVFSYRWLFMEILDYLPDIFYSDFIIHGEIPFILEIVGAVSYFFLADRAIHPYKIIKQPNITTLHIDSQRSISDTEQTDEEEHFEIYCEMAKHILLCFFTFGIWYMIWIYKATRYLNRAPEGEQYDPTNKLLLCLFVPFYQIYWFYKHGQKLDSLMKERNIGSGSDMATLCLILGIFIPIVACILMQDKFNQLCTVTAAPKPIAKETPTQTPPATKESNAIDELKQYKELLDSGVITQEEFDAKKRQILGI